MDEEKTTVTMTLKDFEELRSYKQAFKEMVNKIGSLTYIDQMTSDNTVVVIRKQATQDFIAPYAAKDCELDGYPDGVTVNWE